MFMSISSNNYLGFMGHNADKWYITLNQMGLEYRKTEIVL